MPSAPTYLVLADELAARCRELEEGARLPSENELARDHGVSRITTRAALQELERRHIVRRQQGSGTFVAARIPYPVRSGMPPSWSATVAASGHEARHAVLSVTSLRADAATARALMLPRGRSVFRLERLGLIDGQVASHHLSHLPAALAPGLADQIGDGSLTNYLTERHGLLPDRWWSRAELMPLPDDVAVHLGLAARTPAWRIESVNVCRDRGVPVEVTVGWLRADWFRVFLEVGPTDGPAATANGPAQ
jgi:GntR family transcriptional regulator